MDLLTRLFLHDGQQAPPRTGLLFYSRTPNGVGTSAGKWVATAGSASIYAALGSDWYTDVDTPLALSAAEILALASVNDYHILFSLAKGLAIYDPYTTAQADIDRAHQYFKVSIYADDVPTSFFNGMDTTGKTSYTGGPTYAPDHLGVLRTPGANLPAIEGMRLATTVADGAVLGAELVVNGGFDSGLAGWNFTANCTATPVEGDFEFSYAAVSNGFFQTISGLTIGKTYRLASVLKKGTASIVYIRATASGSTSPQYAYASTSSTTFTEVSATFIAVETSHRVYIGLDNSTYPTIGFFSSASLKEVIPTYLSTDISGAPILPSVSQATRTGNADFSAFTPSTTFPRFDISDPLKMPGLLCEGVRTNKCTCRKANPVDTTKLTKSGDAASVLSVVDDTAALTAAGLMGYPDSPCITGKVYKLDNSAGTTTAYIIISGTATNTNIHTVSFYARGTQIAARIEAVSSGQYYSPQSYQQITHSDIPQAVSKSVVQVGAGGVCFFILPQLEEGAFATSPICKAADGSDPLTSLTRASTVLSYPTAGKIRSNNMAMRKLIIPKATGQSGVYAYGTYLDANNYTALLISPTSLTLRKRVAGVDTDATVSITHTSGVPLDIIGIRSATFGMKIAVRSYSAGTWSAWTDGAAVTTAAAKANAIIGTTYQLGALNSVAQFTGNINLFDTLLLPDGITDPLAYAKAKWGLPA